ATAKRDRSALPQALRRHHALEVLAAVAVRRAEGAWAKAGVEVRPLLHAEVQRAAAELQAAVAVTLERRVGAALAEVLGLLLDVELRRAVGIGVAVLHRKSMRGRRSNSCGHGKNPNESPENGELWLDSHDWLQGLLWQYALPPDASTGR